MGSRVHVVLQGMHGHIDRLAEGAWDATGVAARLKAGA